MKRTATILLFLFCGIAYAQETPSSALTRISRTSVFAFGGVGFVGRFSEGEIDFRAIQSEPPAIALNTFEEVFTNGNPEAKSYALAGIRQLDRERFEYLLQSLSGSKEKVLTMEGCVGEWRPLVEVAKSIDSGNYDSRIERRH